MYQEHLQKYIPPDFDLAKYDKAANMELVSWIENLSMRLIGFMASDKVLAQKQKTLLEDISQKNISYGVVLDTPYAEFLNGLIMDDDAEYASVVKDITYFELFTMADAVKTPELGKVYSAIESTILPLINQKMLGKLNDVFPVYSLDDEENLAWLEIDMNCSDNEITAAFSGWLDRARKRQLAENEKPKRREHKVNKFNQVAFRHWHDAKVLAYIDLVSWNNLKGNKITSNIIGNILFPDPRSLRDSTAIINDTVKPLANKLTSPPNIRRMIKVFADKNRKKIS